MEYLLRSFSYFKIVDDGAGAGSVWIEGLTCSPCMFFVEEALEQVPGVFEVVVIQETETVLIRYLLEKMDFKAIPKAMSLWAT